MPWSSPSTRSSGYKVTAANWNELVNNQLYQEEVAYAEITSDLTVSNSSAATAHTVVSAGAIVLEAVPHLITISAPQVQVGNVGTAFLTFDLWDDSTQLGIIGQVGNNSAAVFDLPFQRSRRIVPTAASHTYIWKAWQTAANGIVFAGNGTTANDHGPAWIRITRIPT